MCTLLRRDFSSKLERRSARLCCAHLLSSKKRELFLLWAAAAPPGAITSSRPQARLELVHARRKLTTISSGRRLLMQSRPPLTWAAHFFPVGTQRTSLSTLPGAWSGRGGRQTPPQRRRLRCRGPFQVSQVSSPRVPQCPAQYHSSPGQSFLLWPGTPR